MAVSFQPRNRGTGTSVKRKAGGFLLYCTDLAPSSERSKSRQKSRTDAQKCLQVPGVLKEKRMKVEKGRGWFAVEINHMIEYYKPFFRL